MKHLLSRLSKMEQKIAQLTSCLTLEQFREEWNSMDELSRAVLTVYAECPEMQAGATSEESRIYGYLRAIGCVKNVCTLDDILQETDY